MEANRERKVGGKNRVTGSGRGVGCRGPVPQAPQRLGRAEPSQARPPAGPWTGLPPPPPGSQPCQRPRLPPRRTRDPHRSAGSRRRPGTAPPPFLPPFLPSRRPLRAFPRWAPPPKPAPRAGPVPSEPGAELRAGGAGVGAGPGRPGESGDGGGGGGRRKRSRGRLTATPLRRLRGDPALQTRLPPRSSPAAACGSRRETFLFLLLLLLLPSPPRVKSRPARLEGETLGGRSGFPGEGSSLRTIVSRGSGRRRGRVGGRRLRRRQAGVLVPFPGAGSVLGGCSPFSVEKLRGRHAPCTYLNV